MYVYCININVNTIYIHPIIKSQQYRTRLLEVETEKVRSFTEK